MDLLFFAENFSEEINNNIYINISGNKYITPEIILSNTINFNWYDLSMNKSIPLSFIQEHPEFPWTYSSISLRDDITIEFIINKKDKNLNWEFLSRNLPIEYLGLYPELPWIYEKVSENKNLNPDLVLFNSDKNWNWIELSAHRNFSIEFIESHPELPFNLDYIFLNPNIKVCHILKYFDRFNTNIWMIFNNKLDIDINKNLFERIIKRCLNIDNRTYQDINEVIGKYIN